MITPMRHASVFNPQEFKHRVDVIGAGATGSRIVIELAKLGINNIHVFDFDVVEEHNLANQVYGPEDVGKLKVKALREITKRMCDNEISIHNTKVDGATELGPIVFLLTDTMSSRKEIFGGLKMNLSKILMIETRMGIDEGRVYSINPCRLKDIKLWESNYYEDNTASASACGSPITVGPTAKVVAGIAVWQLIKWHRMQLDPKVSMEAEIIFTLNPLQVITTTL